MEVPTLVRFMESHKPNIQPCETIVTREAPVPLAHQAVHDTVVKVMQRMPRGKLLDVPAGEGALAARLEEIGFAVYCCDLYPEIFRLPNMEIRRGDLSQSLPYADQTFDYITCVEGLEHIENPQQAVREFSRLLRTGGHLVTVSSGSSSATLRISNPSRAPRSSTFVKSLRAKSKWRCT